MKRLLALFLIFFCASVFAQTPCYLWLTNFVAYNPNGRSLNRSVTIAPTNQVISFGNAVVAGAADTYTPTNGYLSVSLIPGIYNISIEGLQGGFQTAVPQQTNPFNLLAGATNISAYYFINNPYALFNSMALSLGLYPILPGANITLTTNAQGIVIASLGGGGPTNGITASSATNITQNVLITPNNGVGLTNVSGIVNVRDFGATPGIGNEAPNFNAFMAAESWAAANNYGEIWYRGAYGFTQPIYLTNAVTLDGGAATMPSYGSPPGSYLYCINRATNVITFGDGVSTLKGSITLRNVHISSQNQDPNYACNLGVLIKQYSSHVKIEDCIFSGNSNCLLIAGDNVHGQDTSWEHIHFNKFFIPNLGTFQYGIQIVGPSEPCTIIGNDFYVESLNGYGIVGNVLSPGFGGTEVNLIANSFHGGDFSTYGGAAVLWNCGFNASVFRGAANDMVGESPLPWQIVLTNVDVSQPWSFWGANVASKLGSILLTNGVGSSGPVGSNLVMVANPGNAPQTLGMPNPQLSLAAFNGLWLMPTDDTLVGTRNISVGVPGLWVDEGFLKFTWSTNYNGNAPFYIDMIKNNAAVQSNFFILNSGLLSWPTNYNYQATVNIGPTEVTNLSFNANAFLFRDPVTSSFTFIGPFTNLATWPYETGLFLTTSNYDGYIGARQNDAFFGIQAGQYANVNTRILMQDGSSQPGSIDLRIDGVDSVNVTTQQMKLTTSPSLTPASFDLTMNGIDVANINTNRIQLNVPVTGVGSLMATPLVLVSVGDSMTANPNPQGFESWANVLADSPLMSTICGTNVFNFATVYWSTYNVLTNWTNVNYAITSTPGRLKIVTVLVGVNDIQESNNPPNVIIAGISNVYYQAHLSGAKVLASTIQQPTYWYNSGAFPSGAQWMATNYFINQWILSAAGQWDWLIRPDVFIQTNIYSVLNDMSVDGIHYNARGQAKMASAAGMALLSVGASTVKGTSTNIESMLAFGPGWTDGSMLFLGGKPSATVFPLLLGNSIPGISSIGDANTTMFFQAAGGMYQWNNSASTGSGLMFLDQYGHLFANGVVVTNLNYTNMVYTQTRFGPGPTIAQFGTVAAGTTNHMLYPLDGALYDYWTDGTTLYSKQLAP